MSLAWSFNTASLYRVSTIGERNFVLYKGVALSQRLICTVRVHLGLSEVAFIEGYPHIRGGLYEGIPLLETLLVL